MTEPTAKSLIVPVLIGTGVIVAIAMIGRKATEAKTQLELQPGWNLLQWKGGSKTVGEVLGHCDKIQAVSRWLPDERRYEQIEDNDLLIKGEIYQIATMEPCIVEGFILYQWPEGG